MRKKVKEQNFDTAKELLGAILSRAGRSKDDLVQILGREIGQAFAAVLKEPIDAIIEDKKIQITIELQSKKGGPKVKVSQPDAPKKKTQNRKKSRKR